MDQATRRLEAELGFITPLKKIFSFTYRADVENNLVEHEYDHVFAGEYEGEIKPNPREVTGIRYMEMDEIRRELDFYPQRFTSWFMIAFPKIEVWWKQRFG
jgi:isopentenyl-diphosphate delta-isomerase